MRLTSKILACLCIFVSSECFAQNKVGNGGNVVLCADKKSEAVLLDFYEHEVKPESVKKDAVEIATDYLKKLETVAPYLSAQYLRRLNQISSEIKYAEEIEIVDVPDSKHLFKPLSSNCKVVQIAVRNNLATSKDKRFLIRKDLWDALAPVQRAGLLVHEILHEHFTKLGEEHSEKARRVNATIFGKEIKTTGFWKLIKELELPIYP